MNIDSGKQLGVASRHFPHFLLEQKRREHIQEALGKGTILNDEVAESEQRGVLFIRRVSDIPPIVRLSYTEREAVIPHQKVSYEGEKSGIRGLVG